MPIGKVSVKKATKQKRPALSLSIIYILCVHDVLLSAQCSPHLITTMIDYSRTAIAVWQLRMYSITHIYMCNMASHAEPAAYTCENE